MLSVCTHRSKPFNYNPFGENKEPTDEEINKYRLFKCEGCKRWYSLLRTGD